MNNAFDTGWNWIWPSLGATPINQGLDSEMFDRTDYPYSETFVREAIQNSLDAQDDDSKPVTVNFTFHEAACGPRQAFLSHVMKFREKAGLDLPAEWSAGTIKWLLVEDFNSTGLSGDLGKRTSDFWNYWLNFGLSNKDGAGRGGRGIGRVTFLISSRLQSVIGYTRRRDDGASAVCGMAVLRAQEVDEDFRSTHAYLAQEENGTIYKLHDPGLIESAACDAFRFTGYHDEFTSGLALAIPYPYEELIPEGILAAAIENFAPAIMNGTLVLNVNGTRLDATSIVETADAVSDRLNDEAIREDPQRYLGLIRRCLDEANPGKIAVVRKSDFADLRTSVQVQDLQKSLADEEVCVLEISFPLERYGTQHNASVRAVVTSTPLSKRPIDRLFPRWHESSGCAQQESRRA